MSASSGYGPFIVSDLTEYCALPDLIAFLKRRFPVIAEQPNPWTYKPNDKRGSYRVWAPEKITQPEKEELYRLNSDRRGVQENILEWRSYQ